MRYFRSFLIRLFCIACAVAPFIAHAQVTANFTASPTSGCAPLAVSFTNTSTGATSYSWNLGNSNTSFFTNASGIYSSPGTYTVTLTATGSSGSATHTMQIVVNAPPTVSFFANDTVACVGAGVSFTNTTNLLAPGTGTYSWNFGDGNVSTDQNPVHGYAAPGYYSVTQTATNSNGCSASLVTTAYIHVLSNPVAQFVTGTSSFCATPAQATFTDQSTGSGPLSYAWIFGDNSANGSGPNPTHSYTANGSYMVTEIVTDAHGCQDTLSVPNSVNVQRLVATMNVADTVCAEAQVLFQNTSAGNGVSSYWSFGDGNTSIYPSAFNTYTAGGSYMITLVAYAGGCSDTTTKPIYVRPIPVTNITQNPPQPCPAPISIQFGTTPTVANATYTWNFGDGSPTSTITNPSHLYNVDSLYIASLTVNTSGCTYTTTDSVNIYNLIPVQSLPNAKAGCPGQSFQFEVLAANTISLPRPGPNPYPYPTTSYSYSFDDGSTSNQPYPSHAYANPGTYNNIYTLTTANGCSITDSFVIHIGQAPTLDSAIVSPLHVCRRDTVTFKAYAHGAQPLDYKYVFYTTHVSEGINDTIEKYNYPGPGVYHASISVSNYNCPSPTVDQFTILVDSPGASFTIDHLCDTPSKIYLSSTAVGASSFLWIFGDGDTSTLLHPSHTYASLGNYTMKLATYNSTTGCKDTSIHGVNIIDFKPKILVPDTVICQYGSLTMNIGYNLPNPPQIAQEWYHDSIWSFTDTLSGFAQPTWQFNSLGITKIYVCVQDANSCIDTLLQNIYVEHPTPGLTATPTSVCAPGTVTFTDSSSFYPGTHGASYAWTFGDGTSATVISATTTHTYTTPGTYFVKEIVTDNLGCQDSSIRYGYINSHKPTANFSVANPNHCAGDTITFVNTGTQGLQSQYWTFGDGTSSTSASPVHSYSASGSYTVTLSIVDSVGCRDTITRAAYIQISKPHAAFTGDHSSGVCVPLIVHFTNASVNAATYAWSFGNTNTSLAVNPTNSYTAPGSYTIQLIAIDAAGCKDTAYGTVKLYGYSGAFSYTPLSGCPPLNVNFTASVTGIPGITWDFSDGSTAGPSASTTTNHVYSTPGKYLPKILLVDSAGCHTSSVGIDTIKVDKVHAGFKETSSICVYDTIRFTDTSSSMFSPLTNWYWTFGDASTSFTHNPIHNYHTTGSFNITLVATDAAGCKDTTVSSIVIHPLPVISAAGDTSICPGDSALVSAGGGISYVWSPAATVHCTSCNPTFAAAVAPTTYVVVGTDAFGCRNKDSVKIGSKYKTVSHVGPGGQICLGRSISLSDSGAQSYTWYPQSGLSDSHSQFPVATPTGSTTYLAIAKTASCIPDTNYVNVTVDPLPVVHAVGGSTVLAGNKTNLQAYGPDIVYFTWDHADLLSCDSCTNPIATMQQSTWFTVTATNEYGCQDTAGVLVNVLCDKSQVFIPNTFTPNGDGQNDVFYPRGIGIRVVRSFRIYNRWGELVFQRNNINLNDEGNGWDGTFNGARPVPDTYVYALDAICDDGQPIDWKGDVTLIK